MSSDNRIHHLTAICLSSLPFCLASPYHLNALFHGCIAQVCCRQRHRECKWSYCDHIYLLPPMAKTLAVTIQQLHTVFFYQSQGVTLESESTCSHVTPGLRCDIQACQQAPWNTWVGKTASQNQDCTHVLLLSDSAICCFVFSLWIRANKENRDGWTPSLGSSLSVAPPASWSWLTTQLHTAGCVHCAVPAYIVNKTRSLTCTYIHMWFDLLLSVTHTSINRKGTAAHRDTFSHTSHLEKITILRIYRS